MTIAIVVFCDGFVFVLASCVPQLQFDFGAFDVDDFVDVVDADGHHVVLDELAFTISKQEVAFAHARVPNDYNFLEVVELLLRFPFPFHLTYYTLRINLTTLKRQNIGQAAK